MELPFRKWKLRLADSFSWLRDEDWHQEQEKEFAARFPAFGAIRRRLVETHKLDEPLLGHIYDATFRDGRRGYTVEIYRPIIPTEENAGKVGEGYPGYELYSSPEEARAHLPEVLEQARAQWSNTFSYTDEHGRTWLAYLMTEEKRSRWPRFLRRS